MLPLTGISEPMIANELGFWLLDTGALCSDYQYELVGGLYYIKKIGGVPVRANRINKWSKHKPLYHPNISPIFGVDGSDETIAKSLNWGLVFPQENLKSGTTSLYNFALSKPGSATPLFDINNPSTQKKVFYQPPQGTLASPFRKDDFAGYEKNAKPVFNNPVVTVTENLGLKYLNFNFTQSQVAGGITPADLKYSDILRLGVVFIDFESDANEIAILKINNDNIATSQIIQVDITNINTSTYLACFFLASDELGGLEQMNYPTDATLAGRPILTNLRMLEDGISAREILNFTRFILWSYIGTDMLPTGFASTKYYDLTSTVSPSFLSDPSRLLFDSFSTKFYITKKINYTPTARLKWRLVFDLYLHESAWWADNSYRGLVSWFDIDGYTVYLMIKTVSGNISLALYEPNTETILLEYNSNTVLSTSTNSPVLIGLSNYNEAGERKTAVTLNGVQVMNDSQTTIHPDENPPELHFGGDGLDVSSPRGIACNYIDLRAYGQDSL